MSIFSTRDLDIYRYLSPFFFFFALVYFLRLAFVLRASNSNELLICCGISTNAWFLLLVCSIKFEYTFNGLVSLYGILFGALLFLQSALEL